MCVKQFLYTKIHQIYFKRDIVCVALKIDEFTLIDKLKQIDIMVVWTVIIVIALVICVCALLQKLYNEYKIKTGQRELAGKVGDASQ